jgi:hypothetical protein
MSKKLPIILEIRISPQNMEITILVGFLCNSDCVTAEIFDAIENNVFVQWS